VLNFASKIQTIIIYGLISLLVAVTTSHIWASIKLNAAEDNIIIHKANEVTLKADVERAVRAEKSCKENMRQLVEDANKKRLVIKKYQEKLKEGVSREKITNLNEFINYTKRLYK